MFSPEDTPPVCAFLLQVNTTLAELDLTDQDPPIGADGQAALLAALQVPPLSVGSVATYIRWRWWRWW